MRRYGDLGVVGRRPFRVKISRDCLPIVTANSPQQADVPTPPLIRAECANNCRDAVLSSRCSTRAERPSSCRDEIWALDVPADRVSVPRHRLAARFSKQSPHRRSSTRSMAGTSDYSGIQGPYSTKPFNAKSGFCKRFWASRFVKQAKNGASVEAVGNAAVPSTEQRCQQPLDLQINHHGTLSTWKRSEAAALAC